MLESQFPDLGRPESVLGRVASHCDADASTEAFDDHLQCASVKTEAGDTLAAHQSDRLCLLIICGESPDDGMYRDICKL